MKKRILTLCFALCLVLFFWYSGRHTAPQPEYTGPDQYIRAPVYPPGCPEETDQSRETIDTALALLADFELTRPVDESFLRWAKENVTEDFAATLASELTADRKWHEPFFDLFGATLHLLWDQYTGAVETDPNIHNIDTRNNVTVAVAGDVNLADSWENMRIYHATPDGIDAFICEGLLSRMRSADILLVNNEFAFSDRGSRLPGKMYHFRAATENVYMLREMGVDIVSLANNHVYDYGTEAFLDTLDTLAGAGIPQVGAGRDLARAMQAQYFHAGGMKIAFLAANDVERAWVPAAAQDRPGTLRVYGETGDIDEHLREAVAIARANADWVLVYLHWGEQYVTIPQARQRALARQLIDAGVDFVIGAHPHVLQGIEFYNDRAIVYSLGDFWFNIGWVRTVLLEIDLHAPGQFGLRVQPATTAGGQTLLLQGEYERHALLRHIEALSWGIRIDNDGNITSEGDTP